MSCELWYIPPGLASSKVCRPCRVSSLTSDPSGRVMCGITKRAVRFMVISVRSSADALSDAHTFPLYPCRRFNLLPVNRERRLTPVARRKFDCHSGDLRSPTGVFWIVIARHKNLTISSHKTWRAINGPPITTVFNTPSSSLFYCNHSACLITVVNHEHFSRFPFFYLSPIFAAFLTLSAATRET